jgi:hypothetical protein
LTCAWCAIPFIVLFTIGIWPLAGFMPPPSAGFGAAEIASIYQENNLSIRSGALLMMASAGLMCPFLAAIAMQMRAIEGRHGVLTITQISAGTVSVVAFVFATVAWTAAAFRPERSGDLTQLLNDIGWIYFLMTFTTFVVQDFAVGFAILGDKNEHPVFPRWLGYFNLWVGVTFMPAALLTYFKTGPFAWNGLFVWWIPLVVFFSWYATMFVYIRGNILRQSAASQAT